MDVLLVHGYNVTSTKTYGVLPQRLRAAGHKVKDVYLSKYVTLDDDITLKDIVRAFQSALLDTYKGELNRPFACITHSTGGLVARSWVDLYFGDSMASNPMTHLIMLAPPNNGSRLAELGKSRLSRLRSLVGVEPGMKVLDALELGSEFQWDLNTSWIQKKLHAAPGFYPIVITGQWIDKKLWDSIIPATYERGSDGVVRAASANLNMQKITVTDKGQILREVMGGIPFLVTPKTAHSDEKYGIMGSIPLRGNHPVLAGILSALEVDSREEYQALEADFAMKTTLLQRKETYYDGSKLDRYCQVVFRVMDNQGNALGDYALEIVDASLRGDRMPSGFFGDKHKNLVAPEKFVYFLNYDRMSEIQGGKVGFRLNSAANTPLINYQEATLLAPLNVESVVKPNQTTFVEVILNRRINKKVFEITKNFSYQKITGEAGPDWIS
ncbi:MAG: hypothetical protein KCHDKBKB_01164 [Elusimicrobia bacterium]|nr:hypothetical protein [Elusimicrobiota bacterium]